MVLAPLEERMLFWQRTCYYGFWKKTCLIQSKPKRNGHPRKEVKFREKAEEIIDNIA